MNKEIWKYPIESPEQKIFEMPIGAEVLTAQLQNGVPTIWALVNPNNQKQKRMFETFGTGHNVPINTGMGFERKYISTIQLPNGIVIHVFERL